MHHESFIEKITGVFQDGTELKSVSLETRLLKSVGDHLFRLFNTRQGSLSHLPDYGIPDVAQIYRGLPASFNELKKTILILINKYEPRLEKVQIQARPFSPLDMNVSFAVTGYLKSGQSVIFNTGFASTGKVTVGALGRNER